MARVVVVGAGLGGLAAAARLAATGHQVTICEQADHLGGKLGWYSRDGFAFDTGPSLLTLPAVYRDLFRATGAPLEEVLELTPVDPVCHYRFADSVELDLPNVSRSAIAATWDEALGGGAGADWTSFMERAGRIWDATRGTFLESALEGPRALVGQARRVADLRTIAPWRSLRGLGRQYLRHPHQRTFLDRYATYTGSDPRRAPAALATIPFVEQSFGAWYVPGGLRRLVDAVADRAVERGARVRTRADVTAVLLDGGQVSGVRLADGENLAADVVVANTDAAHLYADLIPADAAAAPLAALRRTQPSLSGVVLLLALRGRTPGQRHHTVLFPADYDDEFDSVFGTGVRRLSGVRPVPDPAVYISAPDDPALRPDDRHEAWFVLVNAPRHDPRGRSGVDWSAPGLAESYADRILAVMAERGLDVRDRVLWRVVRTPADLERDTRSVGGSIYGTSSNGVRAAFLRPANRSTVPGLFLVGGSSHPGGGIPLVGLSAAIVAGLVGPA
ncbi:MAG TPA: phytoene desaturase family protein [Kineosporiaceae bacterium]|jgi:phytoene desaturase|nr:phytoene desaturase family protein [Kineosporiaceae bacterium]